MSKVAILVPMLNEEKNLGLLFKALCCQTHNDFDVYIQDNDSDDHSLIIAKGFASQDSRFKVFSNSSRLNWHENWLKLAELVIGEDRYDFICWLAGDDFWVDEFYLENLVLELQQNPQIGAVCPTFHITFPSGEILKKIKVGEGSKFAFKRIWNLCRDWDNVHHIYGLYRRDVFINLIRSKISRFTSYLGSDWWWTYNFLASDKSRCSNSAIYIKSIEIDEAETEEIYGTEKIKTYLKSVLICFEPEKKHLLKIYKARGKFHLIALTVIFFSSKSMSKIMKMHKEILLRRVRIGRRGTYES
ncbi:WcaA Glycosyltransferases involved in cell wall biogenesis [Candidatus Nanopelagicaceae bacterium]